MVKEQVLSLRERISLRYTNEGLCCGLIYLPIYCLLLFAARRIEQVP